MDAVQTPAAETTPDPAPAAPALPQNAVVVNGVVCTPETHLFKDGQPVLSKAGVPRKKPGPQKGNALAAPPAADAGTPSSTQPLPQLTEAADGTFADGDGNPVTPETHRFKDGKPVLAKNGKPVRKPGPSKVAAAMAAAVKPRARISRVPKTVPDAVQATPAPYAPAPVATALALLKPSTATVTRTFGKIGAPETKDEQIEIRAFVTEPASVEIGYGLTLNIGNYESARVDVRLSVPCYREEMDDAFAFAKKWAEERVQKEVAEVRKISSGTKTGSTPF